MGDVLNAGELALLDLIDADIRAASEGPGGSKLLLRDIIQLAGIARRLVSEVERLRARNEALEKVAKAAAKLSEWDIGTFMTCEECGHAETDAREIDSAYCAMDAALSALNSSETPNSSGGAP